MRNFWQNCPRQLEYYPTTGCVLGKKSVELQGGTEDNLCNWYINSVRDHYCFWKWLRRNSSPEGQLTPQTTHQISSLLKFSSTKTTTACQEALNNLLKLEQLEDLKEFI